MRNPHAGDAVILFGIPIKWFVLALLTVQNAGAVIMMRYVRSMPGEGLFVTQTAVVMQELVKGITCIGILCYTAGSIEEAYAVPAEALKTGIPALLYLCQNNLQYLGITYLDAATYTVTYQSKIMWSGILSVVILGRVLGVKKWVALLMISGGVAAVQISSMGDKLAAAQQAIAGQQRMFGLVLILAAACFSSMAGVSFEKFLKGVQISLWARNLQLAFYSLVIGVLVAYLSSDGAIIREKGFLYGYTSMTWMCVAMNAFGGLLVGATIKYADAILKDVALGLSIVLSTLTSTVLFDFQITAIFVAGMCSVIYAAVLYSGNVDCFGMLLSTAAPAKSLEVSPPAERIPLSSPEPSVADQASEAINSLVALATGADGVEKNVDD